MELRRRLRLMEAAFDMGKCGRCGYKYAKPKFLDEWICLNCTEVRCWDVEYLRR